MNPDTNEIACEFKTATNANPAKTESILAFLKAEGHDWYLQVAAPFWANSAIVGLAGAIVVACYAELLHILSIVARIVRYQADDKGRHTRQKPKPATGLTVATGMTRAINWILSG